MLIIISQCLRHCDIQISVSYIALFKLKSNIWKNIYFELNEALEFKQPVFVPLPSCT